jgi:DNA-binding transcriptional ArsR family regulator
MPMLLDVDTVMRTLADPTRRAVFEQIVTAGEITAGALTRGAKVSQPAVSQHLRALRLAALVIERREGRNIHYRARPQGLAPLVDWLGIYGAFWRERFANLKVLLKEIDNGSRGRDNPKRRRRGGAAARA